MVGIRSMGRLIFVDDHIRQDFVEAGFDILEPPARFSEPNLISERYVTVRCQGPCPAGWLSYDEARARL